MCSRRARNITSSAPIWCRRPTASGSATYTNSVGSASAGAGGATGTTSSNLEYYSANVGFSSFELDLFGRVRNLSKAALEQYFASEEAQRTARISLIAEIATAWATLGSDQDQLALSQKTLAAFKQTLDLTTAQFRIGVASELESRQAETNYRGGAQRHRRAAHADRAGSQRAQPAGRHDGCRRSPADRARRRRCRDRCVAREPVVRRVAPAPRCAPGRAPVDRAKRQYRRRACGLFPDHLAHRHAGHDQRRPVGTVRQRHGHLYRQRRRSACRCSTAAATRAISIMPAPRKRRPSRPIRRRCRPRSAKSPTRWPSAARSTNRSRRKRARAHAADVAANLSDARYRAGVDSFLTALDSQRTAYAARAATGNDPAQSRQQSRRALPIARRRAGLIFPNSRLSR